MPKTGGRKKGSLNKRTLMIEHARSGSLPLDYMLKVMRDEKEDKLLRLEMAKAAAPYCHARLRPVDSAGKTVPIVIYTHLSLEKDDADLEYAGRRLIEDKGAADKNGDH